MDKIKVNVITGFLGSGKTTAILNLLKQKNDKENWAIIVNEFGEISIDYLTLSEYGASGKVYEISGGCICCSAQTYFHKNLEKIIQANKYDRIIIEPTGLGGPDMITGMILSNPKLKLMPTICLIDQKMLEIKRLQMIPLFRNQMENADILVLSKCDLLEASNKPAAILDRLQHDFPGKLSYSAAGNGTFDSGLLNGGHPIKKNNTWGLDLSKKEISSKTFTFSADTIFDLDSLGNFLKTNNEIIRAKGFIKSNTDWKSINYTLTGLHVKICSELPTSIITIFAETEEKDYFKAIESKISSMAI
jgi:G3E family GTPase